MLIALPIVVACLGHQPCQPPMALPNQLVRSASPAAIVSLADTPDHRTVGGARHGPFAEALQRITIPSASPLPQTPAQVGLRTTGMSTADKAMFVLAGAVAGFYAGGYLGAAMDDSPDDEAAFLGMPIGAAIGGWAVWNLVR